MRYGDGTVKGVRLTDPKDPAVRVALSTNCPTCDADPGQWCIGVGGSRMRGRRLTRIHSTRAPMRPNPPGSKTGTADGHR